MEKKYNWTRYWLPKLTDSNLTQFGMTDSSGFLQHQGSMRQRFKQQYTLRELTNYHALALLGEPGSGKSVTLKEEFHQITLKLKSDDNAVLFVNLNSIDNGEGLRNRLFRDSKFTSWQAGTHSLYIFLDSFDECLIEVRKAAQIIIDGLQQTDLNRLYLRIACRPAVWPEMLDTELKKLFPDKQSGYGVYTLGPLQREDVRLAAEQEGIDSGAFLKELRDKNAESLANTPLKLSLLLNEYIKNGELSATCWELYERQMLEMCREANPSRTSSRPGKLSHKARRERAAKLACLSLFCGKPFIIRNDGPQEGALFVSELATRDSYENSRHYQDCLDEWTEVLDTALFVSQADRLVWENRSYAEHLAAWYCRKNNIPETQLENLLFHAEGTVVPQLYGVAGWLAGHYPSLRNKILQSDPQVLLQCEPEALEDDLKRDLTDRLLKGYQARQLSIPWFTDDFNALRYAGLGRQLVPYLGNKALWDNVRVVVTLMMSQCGCHDTECQDALLSVVLDQSEPEMVRKEAARALSELCDREHGRKLMPLAEGAAGDDPSDDLKGYALRTLWPDILSAREVFRLLTPVKRSQYFGSYAVFLSEFPSKLQPEDLGVAIEWLSRTEVWGSGSKYFNLPESIFVRCLKEYQDGKIMDQLAAAVVERLEGNQSDTIRMRDSFSEEMRNSSDIRHLFYYKIINGINKRIAMMHFYDNRVFPMLPEDLEWVLDSLSAGRDDDEIQKWVILLNKFSLSEDERIAIYRRFKDNPAAQKHLYCFSARGMAARKEEERQRAAPHRSPRWHDPEERIVECLQQIEHTGSIERWQSIIKELQRSSAEDSPEAFPGNVLKSPGWKRADTVRRKKYLELAVRFIAEIDPRCYSGTIPDFAYPSWCLVFAEARVRLHALDRSVFERWSFMFWRYPLNDPEFDATVTNNLLRYVYSRIPEAMRASLKECIESCKTAHNGRAALPLWNLVDAVWDADIERILTDAVRDTALPLDCQQDVLEHILRHPDGGHDAFEFALKAIGAVDENATDVELPLRAAAVLFAIRPEQAWPDIKAAIVRNSGFGKELFFRIAGDGSGFGKDSLAKVKKITCLADIYASIEELFPRREDPAAGSEEYERLAPREKVTWMRSGAYQLLKECGDYETLKALAVRFPDLYWIRTDADQMYKRLLDDTWTQPSVDDMLKLLADSRKRLVRNADDLLGVVVEALDEVQTRIRDNSRMAVLNFWNEKPFRPKDEEAFSRVVADELGHVLAERRIVINREVRINWKDRTDIRVEAFAENKNEPLAVIIECKGCWNQGVLDAMRTQLKENYLRSGACSDGIYLVGWYHCDKWDKKCPKHTKKRNHQHANMIDDLRSKLMQQATGLSRDGLRLKAFVLDVSLPADRQKKRREARLIPQSNQNDSVAPRRAAPTSGRRGAAAGCIPRRLTRSPGRGKVAGKTPDVI